MGRVAHRPRERHSRLSFTRRAAGPASSSLSSRSPRRAVRHAPALRAAAWLLAAALVLPGAWLLSAGAAEAQTTVKLVSNTGQTENTTPTFSRFINDRAQAFTTGSSAGGYTLKRLDLPMSYNGHTSPTAPAYTVKIHNATSSGPGTTALGTLINPASVADGNNSYTTAGIDLEPNTTYYVVIDVTGTGGNHHRISNDITAEDDEDAGAYAGWSIENASLARGFQDTGAWTLTSASSWQMAIRGVVKPLPPAPSGLLSNTGQASSAGNNFGFDTAQAFTTGSDPAKLTGIDLRLSFTNVGNLSTYTVSIRQDSSGSPGSVLGTLTDPASLPTSTSDIRYAAPSGGIDLAANTTYWVVIDITSGATAQALVRLTTSDAEDSGAPAGWSIANTSLRRQWSVTTWGSNSNTLTMAIQGYIKSSRPTHAPAPPTLSTDDGTSLTITWKAPAAVLAPPTDYDVRYRRKGDTAWTEHAHDGTALTTTVTGLLQGASWEAQVAASNRVGPGQWSESGFGHTGPARFASAETNADGRNVNLYFTKDHKSGFRGAATAYRVSRDGAAKTPTVVAKILNASGLILRLSAADAIQRGEAVTVRYSQPASQAARLQDADNQFVASFSNKPVTNLVAATAPAAPAAPTVSAVSGSRNLTVSWSAPSNTGSSAITDYDLRYYAGSSDPGEEDEDDWVLENEASGLTDPGTSTSLTLSGLAASTLYRVQVRAQNGTGKGPWSSSGTGTTNSTTSTTNNAPRRVELRTASAVHTCEATAVGPPFKTLPAPAGNQVAATPILDDSKCGNVPSRVAPMFADADGDTLAFTARIENLPDNVVLASRIPFAHVGQDRVFFQGAAAFRTTDVRVDVTATDPHGASGSGHIIFQVSTLNNSNGAPVLANPGPRRYALNAAIQPLVLPAATGGDVSEGLPYYYAVTGLPPGLTFDAATRTISGTPNTLGTYRVTYTADDADGNAKADRNPETVDGSDTTGVEFIIQVGNQPGIERVRIVSKPQYDSDGDGTADTYIRGAPIHVDVEFNEPVKVTGTVRLRLDLGTDDATLNNSHKVLSLDSVRHNRQTLRFKYDQVFASDTDSDGIWVQARTVGGKANTVVTKVGTATIVHAVTGQEADLTYAHLPTAGPNAGDSLHKVDGNKTITDTGPLRQVPTVNGDTLTVNFVSGEAARTLATPTSAELDALKYEFFVRGAGGIGADARDHSQSPTAVSVSHPTVTLTLGTPARAGDTVTLTYTGTTLKDDEGKRAPMFRGLAVTNETPGTAGPMPLHASVTGTKLNMVFGADLDTSSLPSGSAFMIETDDLDGDTREIAGTGTVSIADDTVVTVTLASGMRADELGSVSYEKPDTNPLRGSASGNPEVQSFKRFRIASAEDGVAPTLRGGTVVQTGTSPAEAKMALYFDEALNMYSVPAAGDFAVSVSGAAATVSAVAVEDRSVVLTLDRAAASGTLFQVTYTPGTNRIRDWAGNAAAGFRQTLSAAATGAPALQSARAEGAKVLLTYDKPLDPADLPDASAFIFHNELLTTGGLNQQIHGTPDDPDDPNDMDTTADTLEHDVIGIAVSGRTAVLHLRNPVMPCESAIELTYSKSAGSTETPFQGLDGTAVGALASQEVTNARAYRCNNSDWMKGARVGSVILTAERPFATDVEPQASWFTVTASGGPVTVTGAAYSEEDEHELKLSLSRDLVPGETVTVSYRRPEGELGLWDTDGNQLGDIEDRAVSNPAAGALTAAFSDVPAGHEGRGSEFSFELAFSENFGGKLDYKVLRDQAVQATNARVTGAVRVTQGQNRRWTITVRPRSNEDVTVTLPATADCSAAGAICTPDGRKLSNTASATVTLASARLKSAATAESGRGLFLTFTKDIKVGGVHTAYTVAVDGESRGTSGTSWEDDTVALVLAEPVQRGETVTVAYAKPTDGVALRDADDVAIASFGPEAVTNTVPRSANAAATGAPTISGTARAGETLTASTAGIADADGLSGADYAYQWVSSDDGTDADIAGATNQGYTLADTDAGKRIKVRVSFTDDAGNRETLTSAATGPVAARVPPLTASFSGMPTEHDGRKLFSFELAFSENFPGRFDYEVLRDEAFQVTNGKVRAAKRVARGRNDRWTISVRPSSHRDVTVTLPAATDCAATGAVCTEAGRKLANAVTATVKGPALLSVADAEAREGAGATLEFRVTLSRAASGTATVRYMTRDGTATAGEDYEETRGTLTFAAGETAKTVSVPILDDAVDEGRETFTLKLADAKGAWIEDGEATGTIINSDAVPNGWLARFGRTVAESHVDAVRDRMGADRSPGLSAQFAGQPLPGAGAQPGDPQAAIADGTRTGRDFLLESRFASPGAPPDGAVLALHAPAIPDTGAGRALTPDGLDEDGILAFRTLLADGDDGDPEMQALTADDVLLGTSFATMRDTGTGLSHGVWGRAGRSAFSGRDGDTAVDGEVTGVMLGTDWKRKGALFGVILSRSRGTGTYSGASSGEIAATLTGLVPWAGREIGNGLSAWGAAGIGRGDMTLTRDDGDPAEAGIGWFMAAVGADGALASGPGGASLRWHADALSTRTASDAATGLAASSGETTRLRLGVTADWQRTLASGATLRPRLEAGLRRDGGDAETGFGLEIGGGVAFSDPARGLAVSLDARTLALHEDGAFTSRGLSIGLSWDPRPETKRGWSLSAKQSLGGASTGGVDALLDPEAFPGLPGTGGEGSWSLEAAWGTGLGNGMVGSPYGRASGTDGVDGVRLGWRVEPDADHAADASLDLWAQPGTGGDGNEAGAGLQWRW